MCIYTHIIVIGNSWKGKTEEMRKCFNEDFE